MNSSTALILEACVGNFTEALRAQELGASRIELCDNLSEGGTTPSYGTIKMAKTSLKIPIWVIIRPRGGNFVYSKEELEIMKIDVQICKELGADGVVIGFLTKDNLIDIKLLEEFTLLAQPLKVAFHMAFDEIEDKNNALEILIKHGVVRVLTKGGKGKAHENIDVLKGLIKQAAGKITVMPGGGVTSTNYIDLIEICGCSEVHGTRIVGSLMNE
jgi:copper homeostasis protein